MGRAKWFRIGIPPVGCILISASTACGARSLSPLPSTSGAPEGTTTGVSSNTGVGDTGVSVGGSGDTTAPSSTGGATSGRDESGAAACPLTFLVNVDLGSDGECDHVSVPSASEECTTFNDTCPEGKKCNRYGRCFRVADAPGALFESCSSEVSGDDDCDRGLTCLSGICYANCTCSASAPHCDDPAGLCWATPCLPACDPFQPDCPGEEVCGYTPFGFFCAQGPVKTFVQLGEPCDLSISNCADARGVAAECYGAGNGQFPPSRVPGCTDDFACCAELCRLSEGACSQPGATCVVLSDMPGVPECLGDVGVCLLPE